MISPIFGGDNSAASTTATNWNYITASSASNYSASETTRSITLSAAATINNFYVTLDVPPGVGASYAFQLQKQNINSPLNAVISGTNTSATDWINSVSFAAGDTISMGVTPTGNPAAFTYSAWNMSQCIL